MNWGFISTDFSQGPIAPLLNLGVNRNLII